MKNRGTLTPISGACKGYQERKEQFFSQLTFLCGPISTGLGTFQLGTLLCVFSQDGEAKGSIDAPIDNEDFRNKTLSVEF